VTLASDYIQRGVSRSSEDPAVSAEVHAQWDAGWFASLWASTARVRPEDPATVELAATLGYDRALSLDWNLRASYTHYESPWQNYADFYRYDEFTVDLSWRESLLLSATWSPNTSRYSSVYGPVWEQNALALEATWQQTLGKGWRGFAGAGYYDLSDLFGEGYWYGSIGLSWTRQHWQLEGAWVFTDAAAARLSYVESAGDRALLAVRYTFGR
jgi:uncharacterized protein (TIGR02001 family)